MKQRKSKKTSKSYSFYNPLNLTKRIDTFNAMQQGKEIKPNTPLALDPKTLTHSQQNLVIEFKKYSEALSNVEIADYLKLHRETIANRLKDIDKENIQELENNGFSVWEVIYKLERACEFVKRQSRIMNKPELYWKATLDFIDRLQGLGIVFEKPLELEVSHSIFTEEEQKILISHYRRIELGLPIPSGKEDTEGEVVELVPEVPDK